MKILYYISKYECLNTFLKKIIYIKDDIIFVDYSYFDSFSNLSYKDIIKYFDDVNNLNIDYKFKDYAKDQSQINSLILIVYSPFIEVDDLCINIDNKIYNKIVQSSIKLQSKFFEDLIDTNIRIYPVGRLDYDTTGVLLLTNDGEFANGLMHPSNKIDKVYIAKVEGILSGYDVKRLREGIVIDGYKTSKCHVKVRSIDKKKETCIVELIIHEGRNHQVKKMIEAVGKRVIKLKRERYGMFTLDGLNTGEYRKLSNKEVSVMYNMIKNKEYK
jgi:pseudouridine synthase